jgi:2-polyprenyl-3-methyl-5-hydroxy-6-metoxy-1,4-benzoquinol methylase
MPDKFEKIDTCPYCGCNSFVKFLSAPDRFSKRNEVFDTMKCAQCGLVFQNPRVKEEFIGEYYAEGDDLGYYRIPFPRQKTLLVKIKEFISKQTLIQHLEYNSLGRKNIFMKLIVFPFIRVLKIKSTPTFVPGGRLFEIGCSHGEHLKEMKGLGWDVSGLEMSERMAEYAESIGLNVVAKRIEDVEYSDNSFNVVTMSMVLEHLYDPFGNLVRITKWLKPKGQLIFSIPYIKGVEFNIFKEYAYGLQLPHHITFMNKKNYKRFV